MFKATFTLAEAARLLSCHTETLRRAIKDGSLKAARLGREYRVSRIDLQNFWTARGGRSLFGDADFAPAPREDGETAAASRPSGEPAAEQPSSQDKDTGGKKSDGPKQFSLLAPEGKK